MISVKKYLTSTGIWTWVLAAALVLFAAGCINDPVGEDFFNDPSKVMGGFYKPCAPHFDEISYAISGEFYKLTLSYSDPFEEDHLIQECADEAEDDLEYLIYASTEDPSTLDDDIFHNKYYLFAYTYLLGPQTLPDHFTDGTYYFWMTIWDGGWESDHSNYLPITVP